MVPRRKRIPEDKRMDVADRDGWLCRYCGRSVYDGDNDYEDALHIDHRHPVSRGGSNRRRNLQATCKRCNLEKGDKTDKEYMDWLEENDLLEDDEDDDVGDPFGLGSLFR